MKQSEPANPRGPRTERNPTFSQGSPIVAEMTGYSNLGMKRQALRLTQKALEKRRIVPDEFGEAVRTIGVHGSSFKKWKLKLETAYNRQSRQFQREVRPYMLELYGSLGEWETAAQFLSLRRRLSASEIFFGMDILLELDRLQDARALAARCRKALSRRTDPFERSMLLEALARFSARTRDWSAAGKYWRQAPLDQPFRQNALSGIVQLHLACAYECADIGLGKLAELKTNLDKETELCAPGNDLALTLDAEKELLKFKRGLEKLLPKDTRKVWNFDTDAKLKPQSSCRVT